MQIYLKNEFGQVKNFNTGFSWKVLFFGPLVPLFQGEIIDTFLVGIFWLTGLGIIPVAFIYNGHRIKKYVNKGFRPLDKATKNYLASKNMIVEMLED